MTIHHVIIDYIFMEDSLLNLNSAVNVMATKIDFIAITVDVYAMISLHNKNCSCHAARSLTP